MVARAIQMKAVGFAGATVCDEDGIRAWNGADVRRRGRQSQAGDPQAGRSRTERSEERKKREQQKQDVDDGGDG